MQIYVCLYTTKHDEEATTPDPSALSSEDVTHLRGVAKLDGLLARKEQP